MLKRLLVAPLVVMATFVIAPSAHAAGAYRIECTRYPGAFPGATSGEIVINRGGIFANCRYPGPAQGGGADRSYPNCVISPAGNFICHRGAPR